MTSGSAHRRGAPAPMRAFAIAALIAAALIALAAFASAGDAGAKGKGKKGKKGVTLAIQTATQSEALGAGSIAVVVTGKRKLTLTAAKGQTTLGDPVTAKGTGAGATVQLPLSNEGRAALNSCGAQDVTVTGTYSVKPKGKKKAKKKVRTASAAKTLAAAGTGCPAAPASPPDGCAGIPDCVNVTAPNADRCDPIDLANCLTPFPNDYYTESDPSTGTGLRLNIHPESVVKNVSGISAFTPEFNRNDGFSPNNIIITKVPGIDTPAAFKLNDIVPQLDVGRYEDADQRVVLIDTTTGDRHPIWAELDMVPGTPNPHDGGSVNGTVADRALLIHPAVALEPGRRYVVALRNLEGIGGTDLTPNTAFRALRDDLPTDSPAVEARRPQMEDIFDELGTAGIARDDLYLAWDFTVASEENLTERLVTMRDDAFGQLGDTNLGDGIIPAASSPPEVNITSFTNYDLCNVDATPECETQGDEQNDPPPQSHYVFRKVRGTVEVPCYMNAPGSAYNLVGDSTTPCASGSRLHYDAGDDVPSQGGPGGAATWNAPFTCVIPRTAKDSTTMQTGNKGVVFGHGLLQNHRIVESLALFPASLEGVACSTDWIGLSGSDAVTGDVTPNGDIQGHLITMILLSQNLALFSALPDRSQQGYVNMLYLARAMAHEDGLGAEPQMQDAGNNPSIVVDQNDTADDLGYFGVSLGGIFGAATTSVAPDWERAVLSVPGMGFSTLLTRSTQFNEFLPPIYDGYPEPLSRTVGISLLQLVWDRGEPSSYIQRLTDDPLPNTPPHQVQIHEAFGDHQVTNIQTETMARTIGAEHRVDGFGNAVDPDRHDDIGYLFTDTVDPFWDLEPIDAGDMNQAGGWDSPDDAVMYTFDTGPLRIEGGEVVGTTPNPDWNIAPVSRAGTTLAQANNGLDPHEPSATSPASQLAAIPFVLGQGNYDPCVTGAPGPADMPPWTVPYPNPFPGSPSDAFPCPAPPVHSLGQGL